jgi:AcrR family transcriptional regulator
MVRTPRPPGGGLRELKRQRTRQTIIRVGLELFAQQGYRNTTLTQIAAAAEVAPSTLHKYFASKDDIVFSDYDAVRDSIAERILRRPASETLSEALLAWTTDVMPTTCGDEDEDLYRQRRMTIAKDETLRAAERLRLAELEDAFAEAFAEDLGEHPNDLRTRLMASIAANGLNTVFRWWYPQATQAHVDLNEVARLDVTYLISVLDAASRLLRTLPPPPTRADGAGAHA